MIEPYAYAERIWGAADLGDARRTQRAVASLALATKSPKASFVKACEGNEADVERLYRFIRDAASPVPALIDAGCRSFSELCQLQCPDDIVVVQDTTSVGFRHAVRDQLGDLGGAANSTRRGLFAHVSLAVDGTRATVFGPLDIDLGIRPDRPTARRRDNKKLPYEEKESYKWEAAAMKVDERCADSRERLVFVTDRESDVYEYLMAMVGSDLRFVVRASKNRRVVGQEHLLRPNVAAHEPLGQVSFHLDQKGGRKARTVVAEVKSAPITFDPPKRKTGEVLPVLSVNAVHLVEVNAPDGIEPVDWMLYTSEPIDTAEQAQKVIRLYCLRWLVEEYNKCCKSDGTNIEALRMQSADALLRAITLRMFAAVPLMRLRCDLTGIDARRRFPVLLGAPMASGEHGSAASPASENQLASLAQASPTPPVASPPCTTVLPALYWTTLWRAVERKRALPDVAPDCRWALLALAKLGGWIDSKRTGRPGYPVLWDGWDRLVDRVDAITLAMSTADRP